MIEIALALGVARGATALLGVGSLAELEAHMKTHTMMERGRR